MFLLKLVEHVAVLAQQAPHETLDEVACSRWQPARARRRWQDGGSGSSHVGATSTSRRAPPVPRRAHRRCAQLRLAFPPAPPSLSRTALQELLEKIARAAPGFQGPDRLECLSRPASSRRPRRPWVPLRAPRRTFLEDGVELIARERLAQVAVHAGRKAFSASPASALAVNATIGVRGRLPQLAPIRGSAGDGVAVHIWHLTVHPALRQSERPPASPALPHRSRRSRRPELCSIACATS